MTRSLERLLKPYAKSIAFDRLSRGSGGSPSGWLPGSSEPGNTRLTPSPTTPMVSMTLAETS